MLRTTFSLVGVAIGVIAMWVVLEMLGFEVSLMSSLGISLVLTLLLNMVLGGFGRRRRRGVFGSRHGFGRSRRHHGGFFGRRSRHSWY